MLPITIKTTILTAALATAAPVLAGASATPPELPRVFLDTSIPASPGNLIPVSTGGNFQAALDNAQPGDVIALEAGATFTGPFTLPSKSGTGWIVVRSSSTSLPPAGTRIDPSAAPAMPKIVTPNSGPALQTASGAHHFRFIGVEFKPASGVFSYNVIQIGSGETSASALPHDIVFDRCYVHGDPVRGSRRGIAMNGNAIAVVDSRVSDFKEVGADTQALWSYNGAGPFKIQNSYLEAAGENVMFGGADPAIPNLVPSDIEITESHFFKPLSWKADDSSFAGTQWSVKNLLELKNARRTLIQGNLFENNWAQSQNGFSILFTVRNQGGTAPWSVVEDVTFRDNVVRHVASGVNILGTDSPYPSQQTKRIEIRNNLFEDVDRARFGGDGRFLQVLSGVSDLTVDHNTVFHTGNVITADGTVNSNLVFQNNVLRHNAYGVWGSGKAIGSATLAFYFPGAVFRRNAITDGSEHQSLYPTDNFFPATMNDVRFVDLAGGDYHLDSTSAYKNAGTDGQDLGADPDLLGEVSVSPSPSPPPSPNPSPSPSPSPTPVVTDVTPPSVAVNLPSIGQTVKGVVTMTVSATDDKGLSMSKYYIDGKAAAAYSPAKLSFQWDSSKATDGAHTLSVVAADTAGNQAQATVAVNVKNTDTTPPTVSLTSPSSGAVLSGTVALTMTATDDVAVTRTSYLVNGTLVADFTSPTLSYSWDTTQVADGSHTVSVVAYDASGNSRQVSTSVVVKNTSDDTAPQVRVQFSAARATVKVTASDDGALKSVSIYKDGARLRRVRCSGSECTVKVSCPDTSAGDTSHLVRVVARDQAGNRGRASLRIRF